MKIKSTTFIVGILFYSFFNVYAQDAQPQQSNSQQVQQADAQQLNAESDTLPEVAVKSGRVHETATGPIKKI